ncbi:MAG: polysaccharide biosynthesis tyrosine autokinase [Luteibaculaceae bacterium]
MSKKGNDLINPDDLRLVYKIISKNWYFFVVFPLLAFSIAYLYSSRLVDIYAAETQILLNTNDMFDQSRVINAYTDYYRNNNNISNQKRVITSYDLVNKTLDMLDFDVSYFIDGRLRVTELFGDAPFKVKVKNMSGALYNTDFRIIINSVDDYYLIYKKDKNEIKALYPFNQEVIESDFILTIENLQINANSVETLSKIDYRFIPHSRNYLVGKYRSNIDIKTEEFTTILVVTVADEVPARAKMFLDSLSKNYIEYTVETKIEVNDNTLMFIDKQLNEITSILDSIEFELERYKEFKAILDLSREETQYFQDLTDNEFKQREIRLVIETLNSLENYVMGADGLTFLPPSTYILDDDKFLSTSLERLYELELQKISGLKTFTEDNRSFNSINEQIALIKKSLLSYISSSRVAYKDKLRELERQGKEFEQLIRKVPASQREILNIQRRQQVNEKMYLFLLEKRANTIITKAAIVPETRIIQVARNVGVIAPNRMGIYQKFIIAGLALAALITAIRFLFFSRIENVRELRSVATYPVLGGLPSLGSKFTRRLIVNETPKSNVAESFRALRTNLQFLGDASSRQVMLTTSGHPSEGKTFTSVNLASIFALAGKKSIIIDFDMHRPKIHRTFQLDNLVGVSSIIAKGAKIEDCVKDTVIENLKVLTSGPVPPNASELVLSERVAAIMDYCRKNFDYVLVDTPPIFLISDALQLMKHTDVNLIVTNVNNCSKNGVNALEEALKVHEKRNIYFILNNIKQAKWSYYYSKYGYKYGYNYGYAYGYGYGSNYGNDDKEK